MILKYSAASCPPFNDTITPPPPTSTALAHFLQVCNSFSAPTEFSVLVMFSSSAPVLSVSGCAERWRLCCASAPVLNDSACSVLYECLELRLELIMQEFRIRWVSASATISSVQMNALRAFSLQQDSEAEFQSLLKKTRACAPQLVSVTCTTAQQHDQCSCSHKLKASSRIQRLSVACAAAQHTANQTT